MLDRLRLPIVGPRGGQGRSHVQAPIDGTQQNCSATGTTLGLIELVCVQMEAILKGEGVTIEYRPG